MTHKLTKEQSATLAEWLGGKYYTECLETNDTRCPEKNDLPYYRFDSVADNERHWVLVERFAEWLRSPEGQEALMDRAETNKGWGMTQFFPQDEGTVICQIGTSVRGFMEAEEGQGKTRQEALIQACLQLAEMEGSQ